MANIAIICALQEEADAVFTGKGEPGTICHLPVRKLSVHRHDIVIAVCGLGKVNAALAVALLAETCGIDVVTMSGTCGKIGKIEGDAFWIAEALQHDYGAEIPGRFVHYNAGTFPLGEATLTPFTAMTDPGTGLPSARMASGDRFVGCPDRARFIADGLKAELVDMEVAALAQAAVALGLPWAAVKSPTDEADEDSGHSFYEQLNAASRRAGQGIEAFVEKLLM